MDTNTGFEQQIITLIAGSVPGKFRKAKITPETRLQSELGLDSLGILSLVFRFEEKFGLDLAKMNLQINVAKLKTVADVISTGKSILQQAIPSAVQA